MGTWGTGPMANDTALDMVDAIAMNPANARTLLMSQLTRLTMIDSDEMEHYLTAGVVPRPDDLVNTMQCALVACAVIADVSRGEYFYTPAPDDIHSPDEGDFILSMIDLEKGFFGEEALVALGLYQKLEREVIDLGWRDRESYDDHRASLDELARRLC